MRKGLLLALLFPLAAVTGGCWHHEPAKTPPAADAYSVTVTGADVVNQDTGQPVSVGGMPLEGGTLNRN